MITPGTIPAEESLPLKNQAEKNHLDFCAGWRLPIYHELESSCSSDRRAFRY
jgi:hypothetical protein